MAEKMSIIKYTYIPTHKCTRSYKGCIENKNFNLNNYHTLGFTLILIWIFKKWKNKEKGNKYDWKNKKFNLLIPYISII